MTDVLILSPHFDDAVLSCWHLLDGPRDAHVVNVFAGMPPPGISGWWDRLTGAADSRGRMRERAAEDAAALELAGRRATNLDFLDAQYRDGAPQPADSVRAAIEPLIAPGVEVYAPAALGEVHVDHAVVRDVAVALARDGVRVVLYADLPHAVIGGWPDWAKRDWVGIGPAAESWEAALPRGAGVGVVHDLDALASERKRRALETYDTQAAPVLDLVGFDAYAREFTWPLTPATRTVPREAPARSPQR